MIRRHQSPPQSAYYQSFFQGLERHRRSPQKHALQLQESDAILYQKLYSDLQYCHRQEKKLKPWQGSDLDSILLFNRLLAWNSPIYHKALRLALDLKINFQPHLKSFLRFRESFEAVSEALPYPPILEELTWLLERPQPDGSHLLVLAHLSKLTYPYFHDLLHLLMTRLIGLPAKASPKLWEKYYILTESLVVIIETAVMEEIPELFKIISPVGVFWRRHYFPGKQTILNSGLFFNEFSALQILQTERPSVSSAEWLRRKRSFAKTKSFIQKDHRNYFRALTAKELAPKVPSVELIEELRAWLLQTFLNEP